MVKKTAIVPAAGSVLVPARMLAGTSVIPLETYHVRERHPRYEGPWTGEPDKITWIDPATGLACIIRRNVEGALHGYVAVGPSHPFYGLASDALPHDPSITVHGGIDYAEACEELQPQSTSVCHVRVPRRAGTPAGAEHRREHVPPAEPPAPLPDVPAEPWWFGFGANHSYDYVPARDRGVPLGQENGRIYRDEAYVARETTRLAAQLHAVQTEAPMPEAAIRAPALGLDPYEPRS